MPLFEAEAGRELARRVVAASPADETEVTVDAERDSFVRFADHGPTQSGDRERVCVSIRVRRREAGGGYREARAEATGTDEGGWRRALERALELAGASPVVEEALPLGGPVQVPEVTADERTVEHGFAEKAGWVKSAVGGSLRRRFQPAGLVRTYGRSRALCNSAGREVAGAFSRASFRITVTGEEGSGIGDSVAARVDRLDAAAAIEKAIQKTEMAQGPRPVEPGEYAVVLEPLAVSSILLFAGYQGFGAREVEEQSSFLCGRVGQRLFPESFTLRDDATNALLPALPFDGEGEPRTAVDLIRAGTALGPVTDRAYALKLGVPCSGHGAAQPSPRGPAAENLVVDPGTASLEDLVAGVERGLLVSQLHYTNMIEPRELTLTGMTRNGTYWIEGGEVRHAVRNLRFTDTLVRALGAISGIGDRQEAAGALFDGEIVTPALRIDGFRFTSTTDF